MRCLLICLVFLLSACGQSGELYLPPKEQKPAESAPPAAPAETPPQDEKEKK